jgi:hypothetical protein
MIQYLPLKDSPNPLLAPKTVFFQASQPSKDPSPSLLNINQAHNQAPNKSSSESNPTTEIPTALLSQPELQLASLSSTPET